MRCEILCTGTELLTGRVADANGPWLAARLSGAGFEVARITILPDDERPCAGEIRSALRRSRILLLTGGLGPTRDDLVREAVARAAGRLLRTHPRALEQVRAFFRARPLPRLNLRQAALPCGADPIRNPNGTAPGFRMPFRGRRLLYALPGVPGEMRPMFDRSVLPDLRRRFGGGGEASAVLSVFGLQEAAVDEICGMLLPRVRFAITAGEGRIRVELRAPRRRTEALRALAGSLSRRLSSAGAAVFRGDLPLAGAVLSRLRSRRETVALAESCTGGRIAALLTAVPGASKAFLEGVVAYRDRSKTRRLAVAPGTLALHGAASEEAAAAMARGIRLSAGAAWGLSATGVAGPSGGSVRRPVGTVSFGLCGPRGGRTWTARFPGDRAHVQTRAALHALQALLRDLGDARKGRSRGTPRGARDGRG